MPVGIVAQLPQVGATSLPPFAAFSDATGQTAFDGHLFDKMYQFTDATTLKSPGPLLSESNVSLQSSLSLLDSINSSDSEESVEAAVPSHLGLPDHSIFRIAEGLQNFQPQDRGGAPLMDIEGEAPPSDVASVVSAASASSTSVSSSSAGITVPRKPGTPSPPVSQLSQQVLRAGNKTIAASKLAVPSIVPLKIPDAPISAGRTGCPETGTSMDLVPLPDLKPKRIRKTGRRHRRNTPYEKMTPAEVEVEKVDRLEKNRQSARDCRRRKKGYIQSLEERLRAYEEREANAQNEILQLRKMADTALAELQELKARNCA